MKQFLTILCISSMITLYSCSPVGTETNNTTDSISVDSTCNSDSVCCDSTVEYVDSTVER